MTTLSFTSGTSQIFITMNVLLPSHRGLVVELDLALHWLDPMKYQHLLTFISETRTSERVRSMRRLVACLPTQYHRYSYVEGLEARLVKMEKLLLKVNPHTCAYIHQF